MAQRFLHIGMPRTGTSFLQTKVFPSLPNLSFYGVETAHYSDPFNQLLYADESWFDAAAFAASLAKLPGERQLFSNELFVGQGMYFNFSNRTRTAKRLASAMPNARVLVYLRGQQSILKSLYSIALHGGETRSLDEFVWEESQHQHRTRNDAAGAAPAWFNTFDGHEHLSGYDYKPLLDLYHSLFSHVEVVLYEDLSADPDRVCVALERWLQADLPAQERNMILNGSKVHAGVGARQAEKLRKINRRHQLALSTGGTAARLYYFRKRKILREKGDAPLQFSTALSQRLSAWFGPRNSALQAAYPHLELNRYAGAYDISQ